MRYLILTFFLVSSCSIFKARNSEVENENPTYQGVNAKKSADAKKNFENSNDLLNAELKSLQQARALLESRVSQEALAKFEEIENSSHSNIIKLRAQLGKAEALAELGKFEIAINEYKKVIENGIRIDPETVSIALLRSSFCYEKMNQLDIAYVALQNAKLRKDDLPFEQREIELPFRFAAISLRLGRKIEAQEHLRKVDESLLPYLDKSGTQSKWLGSILFQLGQIGTSPRTFEEFQNSTLQFRAVQKHYLRCMELNQIPWSDLCNQQNQKGFFDIFQFVHNFQGEAFVDPFVTYRNELEKKVRMFIELKSLVLYTMALRSFDETTSKSKSNDFFASLEKLQTKVDEFLFSTPETTVLTEESRRLNSIQRKGRFKEE